MTISSSKRATIGKKLKKVTHYQRIHVIPQKGRWSVQVEGAGRAHKILNSRQRAIVYARSATSGRFTRNLIVHNKDGKIASTITVTHREKKKDSTQGTGRGKK